ncbi:YecA/YgfB family protein [Limnochorda pilosa]|nr:DUF1841 family protein [Limnochorda pilosa]
MRHSLAPDEELVVGGVNPILHTVVHSVLETQRASGDPPELIQCLDALTEAGLSASQALHVVGTQLLEEFWIVLHQQRPADNERYARRLRLVARAAAEGEAFQEVLQRTGRNDPCPCGSGRKFKKCCQALLPLPSLGRGAGLLLLEGGGEYVDDLSALDLPQEHPRVRLRNMDAVARALFSDFFDPEGALRAYQAMLPVADERDAFREATTVSARTWGTWRNITTVTWLRTSPDARLRGHVGPLGRSRCFRSLSRRSQGGMG